MRYRKQTSDGDYSFGNGQLDFYNNSADGVAQAIKTRLLLWLGEWYLDITVGTPWLEGVLGKQTDATRESVLRKEILDTEGVVAIEEFTMIKDPNARHLSVSVIANTLYGTTQPIQVSI